MQQAIDPFWIGREDGTEEFVPKGRMYPDNHPMVVRAPHLFQQVEVVDVMPAIAKDAPKSGNARKG